MRSGRGPRRPRSGLWSGALCGRAGQGSPGLWVEEVLGTVGRLKEMGSDTCLKEGDRSLRFQGPAPQ